MLKRTHSETDHRPRQKATQENVFFVECVLCRICSERDHRPRQQETQARNTGGSTDNAGHLAEGAGVVDSAAVEVSCPDVRPTS